MRPFQHPAVLAASTALGLGILGDIVFRASPWGLGVTVWLTALGLATTLMLSRSTRTPPLTIPPVLFLASTFAWRDSEFLLAMNLLGILAALSIAVLASRRVAVETASVGNYLRAVGRTIGTGAVGATRFFTDDVSWGEVVPSPDIRRLMSLGVGVTAAIPLLLLFGLLFASADPTFERVVRRVIDLDPGPLVDHGFLILAGWWATGGFLYGLVRARQRDGGPQRAWRRYGILEVGIPIGAVAFLFAVFAGFQFRYLFGGADVIAATPGLGYAAYARRGFFELVAAASLVIPLLLVADAILDRQVARGRRILRILGRTLVGLVAFVMISAFHRMALYIQFYGLSLDRVYATAFMGWVAAVLGWFAFTVLRDRPHRFAFGALTAGIGVLVALNVADPDAVVARQQLRRAAAGESVDVDYLLRLNAGAVPILVESLGRLSLTPCERHAHLGRLHHRWQARAAGDWRSWNRARARAARAAVAPSDPPAAWPCVGRDPRP